MMFWHCLVAVGLVAQGVAPPEPGAQWIGLNDVLRLAAAAAVSAVLASLFWRNHRFAIVIVLAGAALAYVLVGLVFPASP